MNLLDCIRVQRPDLITDLAPSYADSNHYQDLLPAFLREVKPTIVVETGVATGLSTDRILGTLDELGAGTLYSIDPVPQRTGLFDVKHPRWRPYLELSYDALGPIYLDTGPWDVFLHDSDHEAYCQTFEYEIAWSFVRAGGFILSDDTTWGSPPHMAWTKFCERHGVVPTSMGHCRVIQKPATAYPVRPSHADFALRSAHGLAKLVAP